MCAGHDLDAFHLGAVTGGWMMGVTVGVYQIGQHAGVSPVGFRSVLAVTVPLPTQLPVGVDDHGRGRSKMGNWLPSKVGRRRGRPRIGVFASTPVGCGGCLAVVVALVIIGGVCGS